jgi:hypothetical protein
MDDAKTRTSGGKTLSNEVVLNEQDGMKSRNAVTVSQQRLGETCGQLNAARMRCAQRASHGM